MSGNRVFRLNWDWVTPSDKKVKLIDLKQNVWVWTESRFVFERPTTSQSNLTGISCSSRAHNPEDLLPSKQTSYKSRFMIGTKSRPAWNFETIKFSIFLDRFSASDKETSSFHRNLKFFKKGWKAWKAHVSNFRWAWNLLNVAKAPAPCPNLRVKEPGCISETCS